MQKYVKADLQRYANQGYSLEQIATVYGVTRQRMYQVFQSLGVHTLIRQKKSLFRDMSPREQWLWNILGHRTKIPRREKLNFLKLLKLPDTCPVLGIPLDYTSGKGTRCDNSPSLDRINSLDGYTLGNVIVISWRANRIKNNGSPEEHLKIWKFFSKLDKTEQTPP